jgi:hypothetical protein
MLTDAAGVEEDDIRRSDIFRGMCADVFQDAGIDLRVVLVHLAAVRDDKIPHFTALEQGAQCIRFFNSWTVILYFLNVHHPPREDRVFILAQPYGNDKDGLATSLSRNFGRIRQAAGRVFKASPFLLTGCP